MAWADDPRGHMGRADCMMQAAMQMRNNANHATMQLLRHCGMQTSQIASHGSHGGAVRTRILAVRYFEVCSARPSRSDCQSRPLRTMSDVRLRDHDRCPAPVSAPPSATHRPPDHAKWVLNRQLYPTFRVGTAGPVRLRLSATAALIDEIGARAGHGWATGEAHDHSNERQYSSAPRTISAPFLKGPRRLDDPLGPPHRPDIRSRLGDVGPWVE